MFVKISPTDFCKFDLVNTPANRLIVKTRESGHTVQSKKKALFSRFAAEHPLREIILFAEENKYHLFRRGFSPRRNSVTFRGETPRGFAENSAKFRYG